MNSKTSIRDSEMRTAFMINLQGVKNGKSSSDFMRLCCIVISWSLAMKLSWITENPQNAGNELGKHKLLHQVYTFQSFSDFYNFPLILEVKFEERILFIYLSFLLLTYYL